MYLCLMVFVVCLFFFICNSKADMLVRSAVVSGVEKIGDVERRKMSNKSWSSKYENEFKNRKKQQSFWRFTGAHAQRLAFQEMYISLIQIC